MSSEELLSYHSFTIPHYSLNDIHTHSCITCFCNVSLTLSSLLSFCPSLTGWYIIREQLQKESAALTNELRQNAKRKKEEKKTKLKEDEDKWKGNDNNVARERVCVCVSV